MSVATTLVSTVRAHGFDRTLATQPAEMETVQAGPATWVLTVRSPGAEAVGLVLPCSQDEHFAGLGEQFTQVDKRGRVIDAWIGAKVNVFARFASGLDGGTKVAPLWYSSAGYAAFVHGTRRVRIDLAVRTPTEVVVRVPGDELTITLVDGHPSDAIGVVTELTGRARVAPPWVYGAWKGSRGGHEAALRDADRLRELEIPATAIWLDAHYQPDTNSGFPCAGTYPLGEYPDISSTVQALHEQGFKVLTYVNPNLYRNTPAHDHAVAAGYATAAADGTPVYMDMLHPFEGDDFGVLEETGMHTTTDGATVVDLTDPQARDWWQGLLREILVQEGFDGWMQDFGEAVPEDSVMADGTVVDEAHNRYPLLYHEAAAEEIARSKPDAAFFARGAWLGAQAHAPAFWPADQARDWSHEAGIASVIPAGISLGLMGVAAWGPDIGGTMGFPSLGGGYGGGSQDRELWQRWCQLGAMTPIMRDHLGFHTGVPVDLWTDDETVNCWRRTARWHHGLFPYLYSAAHETSATGIPILRGLMLAYPDDPLAWTLTDQYLLGDALLCAPVLQRGARTRWVYLPGDTWRDWWTGARFEGPGWVEVPAPLDRWPVLQREGTVVAMLDPAPLDLNAPQIATGDFDLTLRVAGPGHEQRTMFEGTVIELDGSTVRARSKVPRRWRLVGPLDEEHDTARGTEVVLSASSPVR